MSLRMLVFIRVYSYASLFYKLEENMDMFVVAQTDRKCSGFLLLREDSWVPRHIYFKNLSSFQSNLLHLNILRLYIH
jgi:hypothetical protein